MPTEPRLHERVPETANGQQGEYIARRYDAMQRHIRDRGWLAEKVDLLLECGLDGGAALEIGMGPGYLGLDWLRAVAGRGTLTGLDISPEMLACAERNRNEYGIEGRARYCLGDAQRLPFESGTFDCVFSYGSLHEWSHPISVLDEIHRVLRDGGRYCVIDLRRDLDRQAIQFMRGNIDVEMRAGFIRSVRASYVARELEELLSRTALSAAAVKTMELGIYVTGVKSDGSRETAAGSGPGVDATSSGE